MSKITEVARLANVAKSTVSNVLSNRRYVSDEIKEKVLKACRELDYNKNIIASCLVTKKTNIIGLFLTAEHDRFDEFYGELIRGVSMTLSKNGYYVMLYVNVDKEEALKELFVQGKMFIEGAILLTPCNDDFRARELNKDNIPYVLIGSSENNKRDNKYTVDVENDKVTYEMTKHLIEQGHSDILFLNSKKDYTISNDRLIGFCAALKDGGVDIERSKIYHIFDDPSSKNEIYAALDNSLHDCTACIVSSDINAKIVYDYCKEKGIKIGQDLAIVALGGSKIAKDLSPSLTTVTVDYSELGEKASKLIVDILNGNAKVKENIYTKAKITFSKSSEDWKR